MQELLIHHTAILPGIENTHTGLVNLEHEVDVEVLQLLDRHGTEVDRVDRAVRADQRRGRHVSCSTRSCDTA